MIKQSLRIALATSLLVLGACANDAPIADTETPDDLVTAESEADDTARTPSTTRLTPDEAFQSPEPSDITYGNAMSDWVDANIELYEDNTPPQYQFRAPEPAVESPITGDAATTERQGLCEDYLEQPYPNLATGNIDPSVGYSEHLEALHDFYEPLGATLHYTDNTQYAEVDYIEMPQDALYVDVPQCPMPFFGNDRVFAVSAFDELGRATNAHIQLYADQLPRTDRSSNIDFDPVGWHNYQIEYINDDGELREYWMFHRTHLVGYQFSGVNEDGRNLIQGTAVMNAGSPSGMNHGNTSAMLYYEMQLRDWIEDNPDIKLDLQVTPIYEGDNVTPHAVRMSYTGFDGYGERVPIYFDTPHEFEGTDATVVYLENVDPHVYIDYATGRIVQ